MTFPGPVTYQVVAEQQQQQQEEEEKKEEKKEKVGRLMYFVLHLTLNPPARPSPAAQQLLSGSLHVRRSCLSL